MAGAFGVGAGDASGDGGGGGNDAILRRMLRGLRSRFGLPESWHLVRLVHLALGR